MVLRRVQAVLVEDECVGGRADFEQPMPVDAVRGGPILPVFALMKSPSTIAFTRWPVSQCASIGAIDFPTKRSSSSSARTGRLSMFRNG